MNSFCVCDQKWCNNGLGSASLKTLGSLPWLWLNSSSCKNPSGNFPLVSNKPYSSGFIEILWIYLVTKSNLGLLVHHAAKPIYWHQIVVKVQHLFQGQQGVWAAHAQKT